MDTEPKVRPPALEVILLRQFNYELEEARKTYRLDGDLDRKPPEQYCRGLTEDSSKEEWQEACDRANFDVCCEVRKTFFARLKKETRKLEDLSAEYLVEDEKFPTAAMLKDSEIKAMLDNTRWADVMNYLWEGTNFNTSKELAEFLPRGKTTFWSKGKHCPLILRTVDSKDMAERLNLHHSAASLYIKRFAESRFIREQGKKPGRSRGLVIWAIGYYTTRKLPDGSTVPKRNPFVSVSKMGKELREFTVRKSQFDKSYVRFVDSFPSDLSHENSGS